jgi:hypothetical protein
MLFLATGVGKSEINELDLLLLDDVEYLLRGRHDFSYDGCMDAAVST